MSTEFDDKELKELLRKSREDIIPDDRIEDKVMLAVYQTEQNRKVIVKYRRYAWIGIASAFILLLLYSLRSEITKGGSDFGFDPELFIILLVTGSIITLLIDSLSDSNIKPFSH